MRKLALAWLAAALCGCVAHVEQYKLLPVKSGERVEVVAPLTVFQFAGLKRK
jgi:hypothetical protein